MASLRWVPAEEGKLKAFAVHGGADLTVDDVLFVGRAKHSDDIIPGKILPSHKCCYISSSGNEVACPRYEVLVNINDEAKLKWVDESKGTVPKGAVPGGKAGDGETLYVARAKSEDGGLTPGKLHPSHKNCYIPWAGKEVACGDYQVLCSE